MPARLRAPLSNASVKFFLVPNYSINFILFRNWTIQIIEVSITSGVFYMWGLVTTPGPIIVERRID